MKQLQDALSPKSTTRLVSASTDPGYDNPRVLASYGREFGADPRRWLFLTGTKTEIAHLATDSLKLSTLDKKPAEQDSAQDLFIHSTTFVLVDKRARLRGVFQTTGEDIDPANAKKAILAGIRRLELEK